MVWSSAAATSKRPERNPATPVASGITATTQASLIAHTWGTETVLTVDGLAQGAAFTVVVVGEDGAEYESGTFLGSSVPIDCRLNAAVLREDVAAVAIRSLEGGQIAVAEVPSV